MSETGLSVTFYLYENEHDGTESSGSGVEFTFETVMTNSNVAPLWKKFVAGITSIEVTNVSAVVFNLDEHRRAFLHHITWIPIISKHVYEETGLGTSPAN